LRDNSQLPRRQFPTVGSSGVGRWELLCRNLRYYQVEQFDRGAGRSLDDGALGRPEVSAHAAREVVRLLVEADAPLAVHDVAVVKAVSLLGVGDRARQFLLRGDAAFEVKNLLRLRWSDRDSRPFHAALVREDDVSTTRDPREALLRFVERERLAVGEHLLPVLAHGVDVGDFE